MKTATVTIDPSGHVVYTRKFALYCAELALDDQVFRLIGGR